MSVILPAWQLKPSCEQPYVTLTSNQQRDQHTMKVTFTNVMQFHVINNSLDICHNCKVKYEEWIIVSYENELAIIHLSNSKERLNVFSVVGFWDLFFFFFWLFQSQLFFDSSHEWKCLNWFSSTTPFDEMYFAGCVCPFFHTSEGGGKGDRPFWQ